MKIFDDDILEYTLNYGIRSTVNKYKVDNTYVLNIIQKFSNETCLDEKCQCEILSDKGVMISCCMNCNKGKNNRINI